MSAKIERILRIAALALFAALVPASHAAGHRAEIQVALCEPAATLQSKLSLRSRGASYQTWLFDDASLALLDRGLRLRLRARADGGDLTLKVAKQDCTSLGRDAVPKGEAKCEYDVYGNTSDGAVSISSKLDAATTGDLLARRIDVAGVLSPAQIRYLRDVMHAWPLPSDLRPLGPIANEVYAASRYDVDASTLPDGQRYVEIGDKVPLERAGRERAKLVRYLARANVEVCANQEGQAAAKMKRLVGQP